MEDAHLTLPQLTGQNWQHVALFGVMDGHGGENVAHFCEKHLPMEIARGPAQDVPGSLISAFHKMDEMLLEPERLEEFRSLANPSFMALGSSKSWTAHPDQVGCTACICCVTSNSIIVANCGDSRAVLCRNGQAVPLSEDHKPNCPAERQRIYKAGGTVERTAYGNMVQFRVNGNLNLSRAIGDLEFKQQPHLAPDEQMICATPDVQVYPRESVDEFFVVACDGIWDVMGCQDVVDFVRERLPQGKQHDDVKPHSPKLLASIMEELMDHCISPDLSKTGGLGGDNMTAMVVVFDKRHVFRETPTREATLLGDQQLEQALSLVDEKTILPNRFGLCGCQNLEMKPNGKAN